MSSWRSRAALLAAAGAIAAPVPLVAILASPSSAASGWSATAAADGARVGVKVADFLVVSDIVDAGGPAAQAVVNSFGDSKAYAAYPYPGEIVLTAHGLSQGAVPNYPLIAQSNPTRPKDDVKNGPYSLHAESADTSSMAVAQSASDGDLSAGVTRSTAVVDRDPDSGVVTADAESTMEGVSIAGVLRIGRFHSHARLVAAPGKPPVRTVETEAADVEVGGQQVAVTDKGLVLPGTEVPLPPDSTANAVLAGAGITVHYVHGSGKGPSLVAPGLSITAVQDVPGIGEATVTYVLGQAAVTAQAAGATVGDSVGTGPVVTVPDGATGGGGSGSAGTTVPGGPPSTGSAIDSGGGSADGVPPVTAGQPSSPTVAGAQPVAVSSASTASLYLVVAIGAVVMAAAAQLFRLLAVRLTWT